MRSENKIETEATHDGTVAQDFGNTRVFHMGGSLRAKAAVRSASSSSAASLA